MGNRFGFNTAPINEGGQFDRTRTHSPDQPFILHLTQENGTLLHKIEGIIAGEWVSRANSAGGLSFSLPLDSDLVQSGDFVYPNRVELLDSTATPLQQFVITQTIDDGLSGVSEINCTGLMYVLSNEFAPTKLSALGTDTVANHVSSFLSYQQNTNPITAGTIDPEFANRNYYYGADRNKTIMEAIIEMWEWFGGIISIDAFGRLNWTSGESDNPRTFLMARADMESYTRTINTDSVYNRIHVKGIIYNDAGEHRRKTVTVQDTASQAVYGVRSKMFNRRAGSTEALGNIASKLLAYYKDPQPIRSIQAIDMARIQLDPDLNEDKKQEYIYPGAKVRIIPPGNYPNDAPYDGVIIETQRSLIDGLSASITVGQIDPDGGSFQTGSFSDEFFIDLAGKFDGLGLDIDLSQEQDEDIWEAIEGIVPGDDIQPIGTANDEGTAESDFANADHVHEGIVWYNPETPPADSTELPTGLTGIHLTEIPAGDDVGLWVFVETDDKWKPVNHWA